MDDVLIGKSVIFAAEVKALKANVLISAGSLDRYGSKSHVLLRGNTD